MGLGSHMGVSRVTEASGEAGQGSPSPLGWFQIWHLQDAGEGALQSPWGEKKVVPANT